ncbi:cytosolic 5'-nucleotidase 1B isoform X2 [Notolabrus celidotus]|uniref:cytosolic 5'-nucleotidase 1B isoform X2 n=1 Tax=Notolabrus celidotus TaxID=1203425 RepID=UPI00148F7F42|nr:cytosolic 5'-nucleotidase 1B isoform X2 [Notolabrus celidotus]
MASTIQNPDVKQKDPDRVLVVAVTSREVFETGADEGHLALKEDMSTQLLQLLHEMNKRMEQENLEETPQFDVILITTDSEQQQQSSSIISSTKHHGLEISSFCFANEETFVESLQKNNVQLFLTTDRSEASEAMQEGVLSALLDHRVASTPSDQLRIMFCEDAVIQPDTGLKPASRQALQSLASQLGAMRRRFSLSDSPLCFILVTTHGSKESCAKSLLTLRSSGISVDEAYCLAGAPRDPIMSLLRSHFTIRISFSDPEE